MSWTHFVNIIANDRIWVLVALKMNNVTCFEIHNLPLCQALSVVQLLYDLFSVGSHVPPWSQKSQVVSFIASFIMIQFSRIESKETFTCDFFGKKVFPPQGFMEKWLFSSSLVWSCLTCLLEQPSCDKERGIMAMFKIADVTIKKHLCHWWHFSVAETHSGTANCFQQQYLKL